MSTYYKEEHLRRFRSLFDKRDFREWLNKKPLNAIVGKQCQCNSCPIALWFQEVIGHNYSVDVTLSNVSIFRVETSGQYRLFGEFLTPQWGISFIEEIDASDHVEITAQFALEALLTISGE